MFRTCLHKHSIKKVSEFRCLSSGELWSTKLTPTQSSWGIDHDFTASSQPALSLRRASSTSPTHSALNTKYALIQGSSRGLGFEIVRQLLERPNYKVIATCRDPAGASELQQLKEKHSQQLIIAGMDITKPEQISRCADTVSKEVPCLHLLFNVSGILHIPGVMSPETAMSRIKPEAIALSFATNAMGPILVCQAFESLLTKAAEHGATESSPSIIANISARVGSISDNGLGGWYSYRASKTALNQLTKTMSLEFKRRRKRVACVLLHPGTCATDLSKPFQKNVPEGKLFTAERGALQVLNVAESVSMSNTGAYLAWDGSPIPW